MAKKKQINIQSITPPLGGGDNTNFESDAMRVGGPIKVTNNGWQKSKFQPKQFETNEYKTIQKLKDTLQDCIYQQGATNPEQAFSTTLEYFNQSGFVKYGARQLLTLALETDEKRPSLFSRISARNLPSHLHIDVTKDAVNVFMTEECKAHYNGSEQTTSFRVQTQLTMPFDRPYQGFQPINMTIQSDDSQALHFLQERNLRLAKDSAEHLSKLPGNTPNNFIKDRQEIDQLLESKRFTPRKLTDFTQDANHLIHNFSQNARASLESYLNSIKTMHQFTGNANWKHETHTKITKGYQRLFEQRDPSLYSPEVIKDLTPFGPYDSLYNNVVKKLVNSPKPIDNQKLREALGEQHYALLLYSYFNQQAQQTDQDIPIKNIMDKAFNNGQLTQRTQEVLDELNLDHDTEFDSIINSLQTYKPKHTIAINISAIPIPQDPSQYKLDIERQFQARIIDKDNRSHLNWQMLNEEADTHTPENFSEQLGKAINALNISDQSKQAIQQNLTNYLNQSGLIRYAFREVSPDKLTQLKPASDLEIKFDDDNAYIRSSALFQELTVHADFTLPISQNCQHINDSQLVLESTDKANLKQLMTEKLQSLQDDIHTFNTLFQQKDSFNTNHLIQQIDALQIAGDNLDADKLATQYNELTKQLADEIKPHLQERFNNLKHNFKLNQIDENNLSKQDRLAYNRLQAIDQILNQEERLAAYHHDMIFELSSGIYECLRILNKDTIKQLESQTDQIIEPNSNFDDIDKAYLLKLEKHCDEIKSQTGQHPPFQIEVHQALQSEQQQEAFYQWLLGQNQDNDTFEANDLKQAGQQMIKNLLNMDINDLKTTYDDVYEFNKRKTQQQRPNVTQDPTSDQSNPEDPSASPFSTEEDDNDTPHIPRSKSCPNL